MRRVVRTPGPSVGPMRAHRQSGQAAVETAALATVVALLLAATAAWLVTTARPSAAPPDVIGRVAQPLRGPFDARLWQAPSLSSLLGLPEGRRPSTPIARALRAVTTGLVVVVRARAEFRRGFGERARERFMEVIRDPVGELGGAPEADLLTPSGLARALARRAVERGEVLRDYVAYLRSLPPEQAVLTASHDAGRVSADVAVDVGRAWVRRRIAGSRRPPAPAPAPGGPVPPRAP